MASGHIEAELETSLLANVVMNDLKALINQVQAQTDKKVEAATPAEIIERADHVIAQLGG